MKIVIEFILVFIIIFSIYYFFTIRKCKKNKKYVPVEVNIILMKYKIDLDIINRYSFIKLVGMVTVLILSLIITFVIEFIDNTILALLLGTIVSLLLAFIFYSIIGKYYEKKSMLVVKKK